LKEISKDLAFHQKPPRPSPPLYPGRYTPPLTPDGIGMFIVQCPSLCETASTVTVPLVQLYRIEYRIEYVYFPLSAVHYTMLYTGTA
jgi:hypothetical protein